MPIYPASLRPNRAATLTVLAAAACATTGAHAAFTPFAKVDLGTSGQRVEGSQTAGDATDDFFAISVGAQDNSTNNTNLTATAITGANGDNFTLAINNLATNGTAVGAIDWRDRGDSTSTQTLVRLAEDFVKNNGGVIRLTFAGLDAGLYEMTSYHRDPTTGQSDQIQIFVTDANGAFVQRSATGNAGPAGGTIAAGVNGLTTANVSSTSATFQFVSNGTDPVVVVFDGRISTDDETTLNGFTMQFDPNVPEPGAAACVGVAVAGLLVRRRRRA